MVGGRPARNSRLGAGVPEPLPPAADPWLEPNICQYPRAERARSRPAAVICPMGSFCDDMEVLYDLDVGLASRANGSQVA